MSRRIVETINPDDEKIRSNMIISITACTVMHILLICILCVAYKKLNYPQLNLEGSCCGKRKNKQKAPEESIILKRLRSRQKQRDSTELRDEMLTLLREQASKSTGDMFVRHGHTEKFTVRVDFLVHLAYMLRTYKPRGN